MKMEERRARLDDVLRRRFEARKRLHDELCVLDEEEKEIYDAPGCDHTDHLGRVQTYLDMNNGRSYCCFCNKRI